MNPIRPLLLLLALALSGCNTFREVSTDEPHAYLRVFSGTSSSYRGYVVSLNGQPVPRTAVLDHEIRIPYGTNEIELGLKLGRHINIAVLTGFFEAGVVYKSKIEKTGIGALITITDREGRVIAQAAPYRYENYEPPVRTEPFDPFE